MNVMINAIRGAIDNLLESNQYLEQYHLLDVSELRKIERGAAEPFERIHFRTREQKNHLARLIRLKETFKT